MKRLAFLAVLFVVAVVLRLDFLFVVFYLFALVYILSHLWVQGASLSGEGGIRTRGSSITATTI